MIGAKLRRQVRRVGTAWNRFWFRADGRAQVWLFRAVFGWVMAFFYAIRGLDLTFLFADDGIIPQSVVHDLIVRPGAVSLFNWFPGHGALWIGQAAFIVSLVFLALGWMPRWSAAVALTMHLSFLHRNITAAYGVDFITTFYLLYMVISDHRPPEERLKRDIPAMLGSVALRLCQLQVCIIYGYSGLHKLRGVRWWQGEAIWDVLANSQITRFDLTWFSTFPLLMLVANYGTLVWEIYFPALIWNRKTRYPVLVGGVLLHLGIAAAINITFFSALMISTYIFFIESRHCNAMRYVVKARWWGWFGRIKDSPRTADQSLV